MDLVKPGLTSDELPTYVNWLKAQNANGRSVHLRPAEALHIHDAVLVDDLDDAAIRRMREDGLQPAAVIETSPGNRQVWLRLGVPLSAGDRAKVARWLAVRYGGDLGSTGRDHLGRCCGFTNRKPARVDERGNCPWVKLKEGSGTPVQCPGWFLMPLGVRRGRRQETGTRAMRRRRRCARIAAMRRRCGLPTMSCACSALRGSRSARQRTTHRGAT
jgi:hypothetical protein